jgi:hypothetical protein
MTASSVLVLLCLGIGTSALAEGKVEESRRMFFDNVQRWYTDTVRYLEADNQVEGKNPRRCLL